MEPGFWKDSCSRTANTIKLMDMDIGSSSWLPYPTDYIIPNETVVGLIMHG